jgi:hypothetical protein
MASSSSSPSDFTSLEQGVKIDGVTTARGEVAFFSLFFFSADFTEEIAAAAAEADCFPTSDLVLR